MTDPETPDPAATRIVSFIEWPAPGLSIDDARRVAAETGRAFRRIPGLVDYRFFGDFETGRHVYLQVWESQAALDAYMASESMFQIREIAARFVGGAPTRRIFVDYTDEA